MSDDANLSSEAEQGVPAEDIAPIDDIQPDRREVTKSRIGFAYVGLPEVMGIAKAFYDIGKESLTRAELLAGMGAVENGTSAVKIATALTFGLITSKDSKYSITEVGKAVRSHNPEVGRQALAQAFLTVPLYRTVYEEYRGKPLPARTKGLEEAFLRLGVGPKQVDKARLAFEKSAHFAGFFEHGNHQLVMPGASPAPRSEQPITAPKEAPNPPVTIQISSLPAKPTLGKPMDATQDPLIQGLLIRLPEAGTIWPHDKRAKWLQLLAANLDAVFLSGEDDTKAVTVRLDTLN